jgi:hypothetical protein
MIFCALAGAHIIRTAATGNTLEKKQNIFLKAFHDALQNGGR